VTELDSETLFKEKKEVIIDEQSKIKSSTKKPIAVKPNNKDKDIPVVIDNPDDLNKTQRIASEHSKDTGLKEAEVNLNREEIKETTSMESNPIKNVKQTPSVEIVKKDDGEKKVTLSFSDVIENKESPIDGEVYITAKNIKWNNDTKSIIIPHTSLISLKYKDIDLENKISDALINDLYETESSKKTKTTTVDESTQTTIMNTLEESTQVEVNPFRKFGNRRPAFFDGQSVGLFVRNVGLMGLKRYSVKHLESTLENPIMSFRLDLPKLIKAFKTKNPSIIYKSCSLMKQIDKDKYLKRND
jgi:hypothetical protein